jgi:small GTP-binding protein
VRTVATAGHVDHGKSTLVLALTGTDPDRLAEEKTRGLTIDLGFAFTTLASGTEVGFVDVPGHVRFIKNMLAGVGAVDVALFVVAASEGWMPQSEEHLQILALLGIHHGMVALTKADLVDPETLVVAQLEVEERLAASPLAGAPVVVCDSRSGRGVADVRSTLDSVLGAAPAPRDRQRPRLWIDRVFAAKGAGTVVTGTLTGGALGIDEVLRAGGHEVRVRGIETGGRRVGSAEPGARVALNLAGVEYRQLRRGDAVVRPGQWANPSVVDVAVTALAGEPFAGRHRLHAAVGSRTARSPTTRGTHVCASTRHSPWPPATGSCCATSAGAPPSRAPRCSTCCRRRGRRTRRPGCSSRSAGVCSAPDPGSTPRTWPRPAAWRPATPGRSATIWSRTARRCASDLGSSTRPRSPRSWRAPTLASASTTRRILATLASTSPPSPSRCACPRRSSGLRSRGAPTSWWSTAPSEHRPTPG